MRSIFINLDVDDIRFSVENNKLTLEDGDVHVVISGKYSEMNSLFYQIMQHVPSEKSPEVDYRLPDGGHVVYDKGEITIEDKYGQEIISWKESYLQENAQELRRAITALSHAFTGGAESASEYLVNS